MPDQRCPAEGLCSSITKGSVQQQMWGFFSWVQYSKSPFQMESSSHGDTARGHMAGSNGLVIS